MQILFSKKTQLLYESFFPSYNNWVVEWLLCILRNIILEKFYSKI